MKLYVYNLNNLNEYLTEIEIKESELNNWTSIATEIKPVQCEEIGKSYAFNKETNAWDILIDDWRGILLFYKNNSLVTRDGEVEVLPDNYTNIEPPDREKRYIFQNNAWTEYIEPTPSVEEILKQYEDAVQTHLDLVAQERGYDNSYTCVSYYEDPFQRYANDARIFKNWRSSVWVYVNDILNQYKAGTLEVIPTIEELIDALPKIEWVDL